MSLPTISMSRIMSLRLPETLISLAGSAAREVARGDVVAEAQQLGHVQAVVHRGDDVLRCRGAGQQQQVGCTDGRRSADAADGAVGALAASLSGRIGVQQKLDERA